VEDNDVRSDLDRGNSHEYQWRGLHGQRPGRRDRGILHIRSGAGHLHGRYVQIHSKPEPVIPKVSQETLAEFVGSTRSRVSFLMNRFRKLGFVEYNGGLSVHTSLLNVILHH
jgi:CRP-like cAMP-binding protein